MNDIISAMGMTAKQLLDFVGIKMEPHEFYQPWVIAYLVEASGSAPVSEIAAAYPPSLNNQAKKISLEHRLRDQAIRKVLTRHNVVKYHKGYVTLNCGLLSPSDRLRIISTCLTREFQGKNLAHVLSH